MVDLPLFHFTNDDMGAFQVNDKIPVLREIAGNVRGGYVGAVHLTDVCRNGLATEAELTAMGVAMTANMASMGGTIPSFPEFTFSHNLAITIALVGGVIDRDITGITGLLATDRILELQPLADLPSSIGIAGQRITADGTLRIRYITPIAIALSSTAINYRLSVKRMP